MWVKKKRILLIKLDKQKHVLTKVIDSVLSTLFHNYVNKKPIQTVTVKRIEVTLCI